MRAPGVGESAGVRRRGPTALLEVDGLHAGYGRAPVLEGVTLSVAAGEAVSIIGPNGAGKSTVLRVIVGLLRPLAGAVRLAGETVSALRPDEILRRGLAYVPQGRIVFPQMTVRENLEMGAYSVRDPARLHAALDRVHALFPVLHERRRQKAGTLSGGEQQMVAIARALMTEPPSPRGVGRGVGGWREAPIKCGARRSRAWWRPTTIR